ncbi:unnamed protein product [Allacma fusca]|uniref:Uncharacterized protein n=1 Tax=Allacma fusca TaxID=39272 RepID=A0A8J2P896_9HEXA|nr:unnamed protein product [Allacma fusca]
MVPPHPAPSLTPFLNVSMDTRQGNRPWAESSPPTILVWNTKPGGRGILIVCVSVIKSVMTTPGAYEKFVKRHRKKWLSLGRTFI